MENPVPYRRKLGYIGMILATMFEDEKKTKKCVAYSGDISDSDLEKKEIYDDASNNNRPTVCQITQQLPQDLTDHSLISSGNSSDNLPSVLNFLISSGEQNNIIMEENGNSYIML
ncbi:hypothetical protein BpHYR1_047726 [Brachionus plicatilis]|uniref:Uncharacterized protein n=1 Tax=Brachionus plicatilis TaxID=10195 RepID=A0A3M7P1N7_BRAPC|nr:hypothetical protein BpHYR1_047726 [Brachionus plicatilis]